ncbi:MAG: adenine phosphoribosyltransferase [Eubacterium sp.]|nr:adenine phosphoribosyltransferase [Eubacterium sp.]
MHPIDKYITQIPDFPKEGILFRDVTSVTESPEGMKMAVDSMADLIKDLDYDAIIGLEARGFLFGAPIAYNENKSFVLVRKKGKLPRETIEEEFQLEYGSDSMEIHKDSLKPGMKVVIVDDLLATGGTSAAAIKLVERLGAEVVSVLFLVELKGLEGRKALEGYRVDSVVQYEGK